jgi:hypothetical protein
MRFRAATYSGRLTFVHVMSCILCPSPMGELWGGALFRLTAHLVMCGYTAAFMFTGGLHGLRSKPKAIRPGCMVS